MKIGKCSGGSLRGGRGRATLVDVGWLDCWHGGRVVGGVETALYLRFLSAGSGVCRRGVPNLLRSLSNYGFFHSGAGVQHDPTYILSANLC